MICYALMCEADHRFEGWFSNSATYEDQAARRLLSCPLCNSSKIRKAIMAPQVARRNGQEQCGLDREETLADSDPAELKVRLKALRDHIRENSSDMGQNFAEEVRRIHFGEAEHRAIHGQASPEEVRALLEDGIDVFPLPGLPEDWN